jgi:hypothetical protein
MLVLGAAMVSAALCAESPAPAKAPAKDPAKAPAKADPPAAALHAVYPRGPDEMEPQARRNPLEFLRTALKWSDERIIDYTCQFEKQENIDGELHKVETMRMKFRTKPFSVFVKWAEEPSKGQEVLYVEGANAGKAIVHPSGLLAFLLHRVSIDPLSKTALKHSRRPITLAGMANMLRLVIPQCERARGFGDLKLTYEGSRPLAGRLCYVFKRVLPKKNNYPCAVLVVYIDQQYMTCTSTETYDWDGSLLGRYTYTDLIINPGLTNDVFDPENREYNFRLF